MLLRYNLRQKRFCCCRFDPGDLGKHNTPCGGRSNTPSPTSAEKAVCRGSLLLLHDLVLVVSSWTAPTHVQHLPTRRDGRHVLEVLRLARTWLHTSTADFVHNTCPSRRQGRPRQTAQRLQHLQGRVHRAKMDSCVLLRFLHPSLARSITASSDQLYSPSSFSVSPRRRRLRFVVIPRPRRRRLRLLLLTLWAPKFLHYPARRA
mmetsp:Transcript_17985/g.44903  ORF Transcript_17985/g.44903 Transcript_17985/m.44903 type:complete len:204 (+) Transcript_17985:2148-2759(+)